MHKRLKLLITGFVGLNENFPSQVHLFSHWL